MFSEGNWISKRHVAFGARQSLGWRVFGLVMLADVSVQTAATTIDLIAIRSRAGVTLANVDFFDMCV